jgi:hypothetical protein
VPESAERLFELAENAAPKLLKTYSHAKHNLFHEPAVKALATMDLCEWINDHVLKTEAAE